jgi:hypothetical protein
VRAVAAPEVIASEERRLQALTPALSRKRERGNEHRAES